MSTLRGRCAFLGDSTVGKSALAQFFHSDGSHYPKTYTMTAGVEILNKLIPIPDSPNSMEFFFTDCAGDDTFERVVHSYLEDISLVVLVFDMTSRATFDSLRTWYNVLLQKNTSQLLGGIIVANKSDMATIRDVTEEEGRALASELGLEYFETSAKNGSGVDEAFHYLAKKTEDTYKDRLTMFEALA